MAIWVTSYLSANTVCQSAEPFEHEQTCAASPTFRDHFLPASSRTHSSLLRLRSGALDWPPSSTRPDSTA
eukprot:5768283-Prymnesium_polylepis.1